MDNIKIEYSLFKKDLSEIDEKEANLFKNDLENLISKYNFLLAGKTEFRENRESVPDDFNKYSKVGIYNNSLVLLDNNGEPIRGQYSLILNDEVDCLPYVNVSLFVDVSEIKEVKYSDE